VESCFSCNYALRRRSRSRNRSRSRSRRGGQPTFVREPVLASQAARACEAKGPPPIDIDQKSKLRGGRGSEGNCNDSGEYSDNNDAKIGRRRRRRGVGVGFGGRVATVTMRVTRHKEEVSERSVRALMKTRIREYERRSARNCYRHKGYIHY